MPFLLSRRDLLCQAALVTGGVLGMPALPSKAAASRRGGNLRVAAVVTEYRPWSHADVIVGRFIQGYKLDLTPHWTSVPVTAMYVDQFVTADMSRALSKQYSFKITPTIREAILDNKGKLAVDGVLLIGEHGNYPNNERGQHLYPRRRFFEETVAAFEAAGEVVPVFTDKHLAARWEDAKWMYEKALAKKIPLMAGSSLPLTWRRPRLEIPIGTPIQEALSVGYHDIEAYGFHALETLQCMVERRAGGEAGITAVQCLEGPEVWEAMKAGRFSRDLLAAALSRHTPSISGDFESRCPKPVAFFIEYADGFRDTTLTLNPLVSQFLFAAKLTGDTGFVSSQFWLQEPTFGHFDYLANAIMELVRSGKPPYPVERTVLTTGILSTAMDSRFEGHRRIETPELRIAYRPVDHRLNADRHPEGTSTRDGGWIELFNGKDLDGWRENRFAAAPRWEVKDGILSGRGGQGYLATLEEFDDFELFAEMRISGEGGISFRCQPHVDRAKEFPSGYQVNTSTGSIEGLDVPGARVQKPRIPDGQWFTLRLSAKGNQLRTWINGESAADCRDTEGRYQSGAILLQQRQPTGVVEFWQVRVRRI